MARTHALYINTNLEESFSKALETCHVIMFSAPFGCGKTTVTKELLRRAKRTCLEISAAGVDFAARLDEGVRCLRASSGFSFDDMLTSDSDSTLNFPVIVIDNLEQLLSEGDAMILAETVESSPFIQFILLGNCAPPTWFDRYDRAQIARLYEADDLFFDDDMLSRLLAKYRLCISDEERSLILESTTGYPPLVLSVVRTAADKGGKKPGDVLNAIYESLKALNIHMECLRLSRFSSTESDYLLSLAPFDHFDLELAEVVTQDPNVRTFISRILKNTRMLVQSKTGSLRFWPLLRQYLYLTMTRLFDERRQLIIYERAAKHLSDAGEYLEAVRCYERCGKREKVMELLARHALLNPSHGYFRALAPYYQSLTDEEIGSSADLMSAMSVLSMLRCGFDESDRWYERLESYSGRSDISEREQRLARRQLRYLDVTLPHRGTSTLVTTLLTMANATSRGYEPYSFSLTSGLPTVINGGRDLSGWALNDDLLYLMLGKPTTMLLGKDGLGLAKCALLEIRFMRGEDITQLALEVATSLAEVHFNGSPDIEFAMVSLLSLVEVEQGNTSSARSLLSALRQRFESDGEDVFLNNIDAMECRLALIQGDDAFWKDWIQKSVHLDWRHPWTLERFQLTTLASALLASGDARACLEVMNGLRPFYERCSRTIDLMTMHLLVAVSCWYLQKTEGSSPLDWRDELRLALESAAAYGFVRPVSELGAAVLPLLEDIEWKGDAEFFEKTLRATRKQAHLYPRFLSGVARDRTSSVPTMTRTELRVLELLAKDYSNAQIMDELNIKLPTVKTHVLHIMKKLEARSRGQAKTIALDLGLV